MNKVEKDKKNKRLIVVLFLVLILLGSWLLLKNMKERLFYNRFDDRGVPRIEITLNGVSLDDINQGFKEIKYGGNGLVIYDNHVVNRYKDIEIKGRGNGTWVQNKKPYQIKFKDKVDLFGMGKSKKWVLLANAVDSTCVRNEAAFILAEMLNMKYSLRGKFIELYVDNDYEGIYYITHAVGIEKNAIDLRDQLGIIVELDNFYGDWEEHYETKNGDFLTIKDLVVKDNKEIAMQGFLKQYNELEAAVDKRDFKRINELIDIESFAQYYLLSEFSVNPDAYWTSFYMYKDGVDDKIHAGPGWDFDLAFGNREWGTWLGEKFYSPTETMVRKGELLPKEFYDQENIENGYETSLLLSTIVFDLMDFPEFQEKVKEIFKERMSGRKTEFIIQIEQTAEKIQKAKSADEEKWQKESGDDLSKMLSWIKFRYDYFEQIYGEGNIVEKSI